MSGARKKVEMYHGTKNIRREKMFEWKHPKYYKELKKNNLTKQDLFDKGEEDEKIQNKISRNGDRGSSNNFIRQRTNNRKSRK